MRTLLLFVFIIPVFGFSQIDFKHITLEEGMALSKKENKPLFVDVFATWCGPCKQMANTTFKNEEIVKYYNEHFICIKIDGEKEDGPKVMMQYEIAAYPTLLYFSSNGILANRYVGGMDVQTMKRLGMKTAEPDKDPATIASKKYQQSKKKKEDLAALITTLNESAGDSLKYYAELYYKQYPKLDLTVPFDFLVFEKAENNFQSDLAKQFAQNYKSYDPVRTNAKLISLILTENENAKKTQNFDNCEKVIRLYFPILQDLKLSQLPDMEELITQWKTEMEAY